MAYIFDTPLRAVPERRTTHHDVTVLVPITLRHLTGNVSFGCILSFDWYSRVGNLLILVVMFDGWMCCGKGNIRGSQINLLAKEPVGRALL